MKKRNYFIVVEGPDNVGKSTLIKGLKNLMSDYIMQSLHYSSVKHKTTEDCIEYNKKLYTMMFDIMKFSIQFDKSGLIFDRSHLGELVYGPMYRGYSGEYCLDIENKFKNIIDIYNNLYLIVLVDEPENLIKRDDGLSFSTKVDKKIEEIQRFEYAYEQSNIKNKLFINIKDKDEKDVLKEVLEFLEYKGVK
jgi:thymidylate kinase